MKLKPKHEMTDLYNTDCLELLKSLPDYSVDIILTDPPYALGSTVIIKPDGKPDYSKAVDFMSIWKQPDGAFWEAWFIEAKRVLKYGGRVIMFGMDRQTMLNKYYAIFAGFVETQSLYWYFISNFPKASDLSKSLDKHTGAVREVVGKKSNNINRPQTEKWSKGNQLSGGSPFATKQGSLVDITSPTTDLAKKYEGYKYSISPLKQTCETIMVFQKPYKTGSCLHDTLAMEAGDETITCGALDIDGCKVKASDADNEADIKRTGYKDGVNHITKCNKNLKFNVPITKAIDGSTLTFTQEGRYPSQTFCDSEAAEVLDRQSGVTKSSGGDGSKFPSKATNTFSLGQTIVKQRENGLGLGDIGGCSKILHKCDYDSVDFDLLLYCAKVSKSERNKGMRGSKKKAKPLMATDAWSLENMNFASTPSENFHPTVKPVSLITRILQLFRTPNQQTVLDCFMGSGSIGVACKQEGFNFIGCELDPDYFEIAKKRIDKAVFTKQERLL